MRDLRHRSYPTWLDQRPYVRGLMATHPWYRHGLVAAVSLALLFWLIFAVVFLMAATGAKRSDAKVVVYGLLLLLAGMGLIA